MAKTTKTTPTRHEKVGDTMLDLGKLIFGGIVLAGIFESEFDKLTLILGGLALCTAIMIGGIMVSTKK